MVRQLPESNVKEHIVLNLARLDTYPKVNAARSQPMPMDLNAVGKQQKGGKGKDKGGKDRPLCP
eukprot:1651398-Amphidinium_carterae.1